MNQEDRFDQLPWFLKEHIYNSGWTGFRDVQLKAFDVLFGTDHHLLIASGTSSGKTEAAMFPVISSLYTNPPDSIGALYISPLKALIDDQFQRLQGVLKDSGIKVSGWHGDVNASEKRRAMFEPSGILQITPESLQGIVTNHPDEVRWMFSQLRFVIVDEVHAFMASDRGLQLLCCLDRIQSLAGCDPRRIGLSATISAKQQAIDWVSAGTGRPVDIVSCNDVRSRIVRLQYFHFGKTPEFGSDDEKERMNERKKEITRFYNDLYNQTKGLGSIVFVNSRQTAEKTGRSLMKISEARGGTDSINVHHGSVSKELRKGAEEAMRKGISTTVATVTLELGIDIGVLDKVVQINPPYSCSSLVQRMGRSGRRSAEQILTMYCNDDEDNWWMRVGQVSMNLVKAVAMLDLCIRDGWVEPPSINSMPFSLLWQQTMAYLKSGIGAKFSELAGSVLTMYPFRNISKDDYKTLIRHMIKQDQLELMPDKTIVIGLNGEHLAFGKDFCTIFQSKREIEVKVDGKPIGTIQNLPDVGDRILLAGHVWTVIKTDKVKFSIDVTESNEEAVTPWKSGIPPTDTMIIRRMRDVLFGNKTYPWMDESAEKCLRECRKAAREAGMDQTFRDNGDGSVTVWPWLGTIQFDTLRRVLDKIGVVICSTEPYFISVACDDPESLRCDLEEYIEGLSKESLIRSDDVLYFGKYDRYIPEELLIKQFVNEKLDLDFELPE